MSSIAFQESASATTTGGTTGSLSILFQSVRLGYIWTGSVQIPDAVSSSVLPVKFTAFDSGIPITSWYNDQSSPNLQVQQQLSITASGLVTGTYRAFFRGMVTPAAETQPYWPGPTPAPPAGTPQILTKTAAPNQAMAANAVANVGTFPASGVLPVIMGTGLEVVTFNPSTNMQLKIVWFSTVGGDAVSPYTFDVASGQLLSGLVLPNLAPFVSVQAINSGGAGTFGSTIFTGLPPITRSPAVAGNILLKSQGNLAGNGVVSLPFLSPYVGQAVLSCLIQNTVGAVGTHAFFVDLNGTDLNGVSSSWGHNIVDYVSDNNTVQAAVIQPRTIFIPPLINSLVLTSQNPNVVAYTISLVALGP